mmetsp:Transcript_126875/g.355300  ORF Transcript_126875/g.355300 Transcript_126875/m.355300 type:complete len:201 (-) Transcript_126875:24-626(-)
MESLRKMLGGFCLPSRNETEDDDDSSVTDGTFTSEPDLTSQAQAPSRSKKALPQPINTKAIDGEPSEVLLPESMRERDLIKATYLGRRNRVVRGLGVAFVALLAVFATLLILHRLGYEMVDLSSTPMDDSSPAERQSKPLIQIQYNGKRKKIETAPSVTAETPSNGSVDEKADTVMVDRVQQKLDELLSLVADIKSSSEL